MKWIGIFHCLGLLLESPVNTDEIDILKPHLFSLNKLKGYTGISVMAVDFRVGMGCP